MKMTESGGGRDPRRQKGFTLIELLIVVGIMVVLAAIAVPMITQFHGKGKSESYDADQHSLQLLVNAYRIEANCLPTANGEGGNADTSFIVFIGYMGNVDGNGHPQRANSTLAANVTAGATHLYLADVDAANSVFMVGHSITIAADNVGNPSEDAVVWAISTSTNMLTLKDPLSNDHSLAGGAPGVNTRPQGLVDSGLMLVEAPESSAAVFEGIDNLNGGAQGTYLWYCNPSGSAVSDPEKMADVYP